MAILDQSVGYGVVLGLGAFFAVSMSLVTLAQKRYHHEHQTSEMFMTAHREVKPGLVAAAVVSSWTWAATLLQSSTVAYKYGVSGYVDYTLHAAKASSYHRCHAFMRRNDNNNPPNWYPA
jgi:Na+/proline symporter